MWKRIRIWLTDHLPQSLVGRLEFHLKPERLDCWGGPFNGQGFRQLMFVDFLNACHFQALVETGSFRGSTTLFLCHNSNGAPVYSTEIHPRYFEVARLRLRSQKNLHLYNLDSRAFLSSLELPGNITAFFYLDSHWYADLPLAEEIELIADHFQNFVIMIDDFAVPNDPGYGFFDHDLPGQRLSLREFPYHRDSRFAVYFPSRPSHGESGLRKGCVVLASIGLKNALDSLDCVRPAESSQQESGCNEP